VAIPRNWEPETWTSTSQAEKGSSASQHSLCLLKRPRSRCRYQATESGPQASSISPLDNQSLRCFTSTSPSVQPERLKRALPFPSECPRSNNGITWTGPLEQAHLMRIRAVLQHNAAMSNRSASHAERLAHAFDDQTRFSPPPFSFLLHFRSPLQHHVLLHNRNQGGKISVAQRRQTISLPLCPASTQGSSTHFFSTLPFPTNPFFSPSNDKSTSTSSQSISSCTHPLQPSGLPLRPTHPRPFTSLTNQASHRITNSAPGVNSQRLPTQPRPIRRSTTNRIPQTRCLLPLHASRATRLKPYRASRISASCGVCLCLGMARYFARARVVRGTCCSCAVEVEDEARAAMPCMRGKSLACMTWTWAESQSLLGREREWMRAFHLSSFYPFTFSLHLPSQTTTYTFNSTSSSNCI
jgi:hypothetical protein